MKKIIAVVAAIVLFALIAKWAWAATDFSCVDDCTKRYMWGYCIKFCSY